MTESLTLGTSGGDDHILFFYNDSNERYKVLARYFEEGLVNNELCIFVTADSQFDAIQGFNAAGLDIQEPLLNNSLRIYEMSATYVPHSKFVTNYMLNNVSSFIESAKTEGYTGIRTAGEMSWMMEHPESVKDAVDYEHKVNGLGGPDSNFKGLCLYPIQNDLKVESLEEVTRSHTSFVYQGQLVANPYFSHA